MSAAGTHEPARPGTVRRTLAELGERLVLPYRPRRVPAARLMPPKLRFLAGLLIAVLIVGTLMLFADARAVAFTATWPRWLVDTFNEITDFGQSGWFLIPLAVLIVALSLLASQTAGRFAAMVTVSLLVRLEFLFLAIALPGLFVTIVKRLIGRVRPSDVGPFVYFPWSWRNEYASLPSGHSTTAFAAAFAVMAIWPAARIPLLVFATVIALSRVVIHAHFASDVIAAAFVGAFGAMLVRNWFAARRLVFTVDPEGTVRTMPGPSPRRLKTVARRLLPQ